LVNIVGYLQVVAGLEAADSIPGCVGCIVVVVIAVISTKPLHDQVGLDAIKAPADGVANLAVRLNSGVVNLVVLLRVLVKLRR
jgi:hypothetical protein